MGSCSRSLLVAVTVIAVVGCSNAPKQEDQLGPTRAVSRAPTTAAQPVTVDAVQETESQKLGRLVKGLEGQSIYFAYDDFAIQPKYQQTIQVHADVLKQVDRGTVVLEGNADERGSSEYNLALGQKRAEAVKRALKAQGVLPDKTEAISFGKEKPRALCHEDKCWADNRRVDFTYKLK